MSDHRVRSIGLPTSDQRVQSVELSMSVSFVLRRTVCFSRLLYCLLPKDLGQHHVCERVIGFGLLWLAFIVRSVIISAVKFQPGVKLILSGTVRKQLQAAVNPRCQSEASALRQSLLMCSD